MATKILHTADDLLALPDDGMRHELVQGELRSMTPSEYEHGRITARLARLVDSHVTAHQLGDTLGAETGFRLAFNPDTVRAPAVAFVSRERVAEVAPPRGYGLGAPDLVAEVVSPNDSYEEVEEKVLDWLRAGTRLVWVVNPRARTVTIHAPGEDARMLRESDSLTGGDVLPGFVCQVAELFA
ncbi:MAG: Uma2 family endonuclease [Gemmatimonadota bacterium]|nr:Uma2 family endonuclease [Gemmatimonadota bacterium]